MTDTGATAPEDTLRLVVIRHAKTEPNAATDHARQLVDRGRRDARRLGRWLAEVGVQPDVLLVSSAARARQTADVVVDELPEPPVTEVLDDLYVAGPFDVLEACAQVGAEIVCIGVVGHNPTMEALVGLLLDDGTQVTHFPTSAVAVIDLPGPWDALQEATGTLAHLHTPHDD